MTLTKASNQIGFIFRSVCGIIKVNKAKGMNDMAELFANDPDRTFGITDEEMDERFTKIVLLKKEEARIKGCPIQYYDDEKKAPYLLYPDGKREYFYG